MDNVLLRLPLIIIVLALFEYWDTVVMKVLMTLMNNYLSEW